MSLRRLASETAVYGLSSILGRGIYFLLTPLYTDVFTPFELGIQTDVFTVVSFLMILAVFRLDVAFFRLYREADRPALLGTTQLTVTALAGTLALALLVGAGPLARAFGYPAYEGLFALGAGILLFDALTEVPLARLRMDQRPWRFAFVRTAGILVNVGLNLLWLWLLPRWGSAPAWLSTPLAGISYIFLANVASSAVVFALAAPALRGMRWRIDGRLLREMLAFAGPLVVVGFAYIVNELLDRKLLPLVWPGGTEEGLTLSGVYAQNYKLAMLLALFTQAYRYGVEPFFFRERGTEGAETRYARLAHYYLLAALTGFVAVSLFQPTLSHVFLRTAAFREGARVVPILLLAQVCLGLYYNVSVWYKVTDQTRFGAYISVGGAALTVALNLLLIPRYGYLGCAWTTLACYAAMLAAGLALGRSRYPVPYPALRMLAFVALAVAVVGAFWWLSPKLQADAYPLIVDGGPAGVWVRSLALASGLLVVWALAVWREVRRPQSSIAMRT